MMSFLGCKIGLTPLAHCCTTWLSCQLLHLFWAYRNDFFCQRDWCCKHQNDSQIAGNHYLTVNWRPAPLSNPLLSWFNHGEVYWGSQMQKLYGWCLGTKIMGGITRRILGWLQEFNIKVLVIYTYCIVRLSILHIKIDLCPICLNHCVLWNHCV